MSSRHIVAVALAAAALTGASAASATVGEAVFTGFVQAGVGSVGSFGVIGGQAFTAVYDFDTALGTHILAPGQREINYGGTGPGGATPILSTSLTINGVTRAFDASAYGNDQTFTEFVGTPAGAMLSDDILFVASSADGGQLLNYFNTAPHLMGGDFSHSFSVTPSGPGAIGTVGRFNLPGAGSINLNADHLTVTMRLDNAGVPEPAAWAMMLVGFGGLGAALRRRRAAAAIAA
jgi:hypothetical protein